MFNLNSVDLFITQYSIVSGIVKTATILPQSGNFAIQSLLNPSSLFDRPQKCNK
jgi:hypothetical protein